MLLPSCKKAESIRITVCITGDNYSLQCSNPRLPDNQRDFTLPYQKNYIAIPPQDFKKIIDLIADKNRQASKWSKKLSNY